MQIGERGKNLLIELENCKLFQYRDSVGILTIGIGHRLTTSELSSGKLWIRGTRYEYASGLTLDQVMELLNQDLFPVMQAIGLLVKGDLRQHEYDALCCFVFNVGVGAFESSTVLKFLNEGIHDQVPTQMRRWFYAGGEVLQGLKNRREKEVKLWRGQG